MGQHNGYNSLPGEIHDERSINCYLSLQSENGSRGTPETKILQIPKRFLRCILLRPHIFSAPRSCQTRLQYEFATFILAHIDHVEDNARFILQQHSVDVTTTFTSPRSSYYTLVHSTSADHTSCPYSFAFFTCLLSSSSARPTFFGIRQEYLAQDVCRQHNDIGSIMWDRAERNISSVNFLEFSHTVNAENHAATGPDSSFHRGYSTRDTRSLSISTARTI